MSTTPSASINIQKRVRRNLIVLTVIILFGISVVAVVLWLTNGKVKDRLAVQQELNALVKSEQDTQELRLVVTNELETVQKINAFFPNENEVYTVFAQMERLMLDVDKSGVLSFADLQPRKIAGQNTLTLDARMLATREQLVLFLRKLERLPYIVEVVSVDTQQFEDNLLLVIMEVRLYVADPFI